MASGVLALAPRARIQQPLAAAVAACAKKCHACGLFLARRLAVPCAAPPWGASTRAECLATRLPALRQKTLVVSVFFGHFRSPSTRPVFPRQKAAREALGVTRNFAKGHT